MLTDEPILLQRISEGDQNAFRELFGYYYPKVRCFLAGFIENEDDVKDLSQNIFVKIWLITEHFRQDLADAQRPV